VIVFAQVGPEALSRSFDQYKLGAGERFVLYTAAFVAVVLGMVLVWKFLNYGRVRRKPLLLFYDLADEHGLSRKMRRRLLHFAKVHGIKDPACLFVCPELLRHVKSLEESEARSQKERRRLDGFFSEFEGLAYGAAELEKGGES